MKNRIKLTLSLFIIVGIIAYAVPKMVYASKTESWMETLLPKDLSGYSYARDYKMDEQTYDILVPFGIVSRDYKGRDGRNYEYTVIAGNTRKSFHDPQVCFSAQGWKFDEQDVRNVSIPQLGNNVKATVIKISNSQSQGLTLYFYKGPSGIRHSPVYLPFDITWAKLMLRRDIDAQFYRFILQPASNDLDKDFAELERFAQSFFSSLEENKEAAGYFIGKK